MSARLLRSGGGARLGAALLATGLALSWAARGEAHPFGTSSVNRYLGVEVGRDGAARIAYVLDFAELPAVTELARLDADSDGSVLPSERDAYLDALLPGVFSHWNLEVDGQRVTPRVAHRAIEAPPGDNGLNTLRVLLEVQLDGAPAAGTRTTREVRVFDDAYGERSGWRELRAEGADGVSVEREEVERPDAGAVEGERRLRRENRARFVFRLPPEAPLPRATGGETSAPAAKGSLSWRIGLAVTLAVLFAAVLRVRGFATLDARVRLLASLALGVSVATLHGAWGAVAIALGAHGAAIALFAATAGARLPWWLPRVGAAAAWGAFAGLTRAFTESARDPLDARVLGARVALGIAAALPLAASTTPIALADALARLRVPGALVEGVTATARGLVILRSEADRLARARRLRAPDAGFFERVTLWGTLAAALLRRGLARADRSQLALTLRGFDGTNAGLAPAPLAARGWIALAATLAACACAHMSVR